MHKSQNSKSAVLQKNKKTNLILFLLLAILAIAIYTVNNYKKNKQSIYFPLDVRHLEKIIIFQDPMIVLKKIDDEWFVKHGEEMPANKKAMQDIFNMLSTPLRDEYPLASVPLKELSLAPPNLMVQLNEDFLLFGRLSPLEQMHYVQFRDKVYLASPFLQVRLSQTLETFLKPDDIYDEQSHKNSHGDH